MKLLFFVVAFCWFTLSYDHFPRDPDHTLEKVTGGTLVVGYSENPP